MKWIISIATSLVIIVAGFFAYFFISDNVPDQLNQASLLIGEAKEVNVSTDMSKEIKEIIQDVQEKVLTIETREGFGSGFLYNDKGDILTNAHVVLGFDEVTVITTTNNEYRGEVIGISDTTDVAVVRVSDLKGVEPVKISKDKAEIGDEVLALGSPLGYQNTVTTGIISGIDRDLDVDQFRYENVYQISAPIAPGNSGGPLVNSQTGEVIGINSAGYNQGSIGFSIPIINILPTVEKWSNRR